MREREGGKRGSERHVQIYRKWVTEFRRHVVGVRCSTVDAYFDRISRKMKVDGEASDAEHDSIDWPPYGPLGRLTGMGAREGLDTATCARTIRQMGMTMDRGPTGGDARDEAAGRRDQAFGGTIGAASRRTA